MPKDLDMVEQLGSGVPRILRVYSKECFVFGDSFTRMVFPLEGSEKTVEKTVEKIIKAIKENPEITINQLSKITGLTRRGVEWQIAKLKEQNKLKRIGPDRGGYWEVINEK